MIERREFESLCTEVERDSVSLRIHSLCSRGEPGKDSPVVLVPGQGASGVSMLPTARLLPRERDVLVVDPPGHGKSDRPRGALSLSSYAAIMAAWLEALDLKQAVWVGHSFGAQVLVELAIERPDIVDRLALISLTVDPEARTMTSQLARLLLDATREPPALLRLLAHDYLRAGLRTLLEIGRVAVRDRVEEKLPSIKAQTLLVRGARDPVVPERWAEQMAKLLPRAKLVVIPGAPHAVQYVSPLELARELQEFLSQPTGAPVGESIALERTNDPR
jgi:2-hydroxy-6-oxonona-2,4-dienedioate hydrolase